MNRINLTSQEVAALLQGLSQGEKDFSVEPEPAPEVPRPPAGLGSREQWCGQGFRKISLWWAAITEPQWPHI